MHHIYETGLEKAKHIKEPFIVRPCYEKTLGHPVFFGHVEKQLFLQVTGDHGAKQMMNLIDHHIHVPVDDKGVILDIDTVDDYRSALKRIQTNQGLNH
jgi:molybdenum cofactor cytidylyltransferase